MINRFFRFYYQHKLTCWITLIAIILFLLIIRLLNSMVIEQKDKNSNVEIVDEKAYQNKIDIKDQISQEEIKQNETLVIDQFIKYCNAKDIQNAYSLLSDDCKQNIFPTIDDFEKKYVNTNFNVEKIYSKERYLGNTIKVYLYENMLSTGKINENALQDYYTIIEENDSYKLNICSYIGKNELNKIYENDSMKIDIQKKEVYMEYEIYKLNIANYTDKTILLDTKQSTKTMYAIGSNKLNYYSASHEIPDNKLLIRPKSSNVIYIKYIKEYGNNTLRKIVFSDVILDYTENTNKNNYEKNNITLDI